MSTALITGATSGLGNAVAAALAGRGWHVLAHGRDTERTDRVTAELRATGARADGYVADFASLDSTADLAEQVAADHPGLDLLVNNAGVGFGQPGGRREVSTDGYELRLAVNYLAPVLLTRALHGPLTAAAPSHVVNIGSAGQSVPDFADPQCERGYNGTEAYTRSKFALAAFTFELADEWAPDGVAVNCVHPATFMDTAMVRESGIRPAASVASGCRAVLHVIERGTAVTGKYFEGTRVTSAHPRASDPTVRRRLDQLTTTLVSRP